MKKFGFKIFSTNLQKAPALIKMCGDFASTKEDMFIELMVVPTSTKDDLIKIKHQLKGVEVRIHAPHTAFGFDVGDVELEQQNRKIFALSQYAADLFEAKTIVVHAGCEHGNNGLEESVRQFKLFNEKRIIVENLPVSSNGHARRGTTPDEISYIMHESGCGFCFDFSHAICAALSLNTDVEKQLKNFYALKPNVYHMCDGNINQAKDLHLHFGQGNYPLKHYLNDYTDKNAYITMETGNGAIQQNDLWVADYQYLKSLQEI